ncbi:bifunctional proline dehydrogenase/L-glutamate gamma-semialdehyde dehydrogenase [Lysinibacter sp. HNR]|uniref:bifunctional proline dehydrogenase/L-glutamate gamma-semialdehyde dehydrogenase n=1 Tax=Lysinibacter sp. HNR TaxID=3031408 RepID=UPI00243544D8|nr:bifunctional proline dehydrogenase/L-glutamate gamma-semialdehyde dehydrogenase [Lysinibacter sp. HNR]WGD37661.1 bifunctional proline dehydrogenase/L-glutamate gamma-semialdehyde dehydrogenase [Lysinibacter sp. HNR]
MADSADLIHPRNLADDAILLVRQWLTDSESADTGATGESRLLFELLRDDDGLTFIKDFIDGVIQPEDAFVAAMNLKRVAARAPESLSPALRLAVQAGGVASLALPWAVIPLAKGALRRTVSHLIIDAPPEGNSPGKKPDVLGKALARIRAAGHDPSVSVLGETVLGEKEARRRAGIIREVIKRDDVERISLRLSSIASNITLWGFEETVSKISARLLVLYELAAQTGTFITLDAEEFGHFDLTNAIFRDILNRPQLRSMSAGITLQAYLPDSYKALKQLTRWAMKRVENGGAPLYVRLVKGESLSAEGVNSTLNGWPRPTFSSKRETDTNYKRLLDYALRPEHVRALKVGVATHNLFDVALAHKLAERRGVSDSVQYEMLLGMEPAHIDAVSRTVGSVQLYTPVVGPGEFDAAVSALARRLEEGFSADSFLSAFLFSDDKEEVFTRESERFVSSLARLGVDVAPTSRRTQDRSTEHQVESEDSALFHRRAEEPGPDTLDEGMTQAVMRLSDMEEASHPILEPAALPDDIPVVSLTGFVNEPNTDPSRAANRAWAEGLLARAADTVLPEEALAAAAVRSPAEINSLIVSVRERAVSWGAMSGADRGAILRRVAFGLVANRDRFIECLVTEVGKPLTEADLEVSRAIDYTRYYAARAADLDTVVGARFVPSRLTVVTPPWNRPVCTTIGSTLAALAAGSGVILKPAPQARHCGALVAEVLWEAGVPRDLLALVDILDAGITADEDTVQADTGVLLFTETSDLSRAIGIPETQPSEGGLGRYLVSHPGVDRIVLTGSWETAQLFQRQRPELQLVAETSGKNAIVVTPSADVDAAVAAIVSSAFGYSGQDCSSASLVILVGSVARSKRFMRQLEDAVRSLAVGSVFDSATQVGALVEAPSNDLWGVLTSLEPGESWLVEPKPVDAAGRLWSPGVKLGVKRGSPMHRMETPGPVLGVMTALSLTEAIDIQNSTGYGLTAGLHSLDAEEVGIWVDNVQAGNLCVNREITGLMVERQPFGGWKKSSAGVGFKAGGPNYLLALGDWVADEGDQSSTLHLRGLDDRVAALIEASQELLSYEEFDVLRRAALSDAYVWGTEFSQVHDVSQLGIERNLLRYWPADSMIRKSEDADLPQLLRVLVAGALTRAQLSLSVSVPLPRAVREVLENLEIDISIESDAEWYERLAIGVPGLDRVRLVGGRREEAARSLAQQPGVRLSAQPVTNSGRLEMLPFLREQSISITAHRFGIPSSLTDTLF